MSNKIKTVRVKRGELDCIINECDMKKGDVLYQEKAPKKETEAVKTKEDPAPKKPSKKTSKKTSKKSE